MITTPPYRFAVNTNCLRKTFSTGAIAELVRRAGYDGIEWGLPTLAETPAALREMARASADNGLAVAAWINAGELWKTDLIHRWSEAVAAAGGGMLRVGQPWVSFDFNQSIHQRDSFPLLEKLTRDGLERLVPLSRQYGIRYVIEIHMGGVVASPATARDLVAGLDPRAVGVIYDPANTIYEGFLRPRTGVELLGDYLAYVHVKNLTIEPDTSRPDPTPGVRRTRFNWKAVPLWEGMIDWAEFAFALRLAGWGGWLSVEEFDADHAEAELVARRAFIRACLDAAPATSSPPYAQNND